VGRGKICAGLADAIERRYRNPDEFEVRVTGKISARAAHCGIRITSKRGSRNSRSSRAETTSAKKRPTTSPQMICWAPTLKSQDPADTSI
jgi:hypothetical protein